MDRFLLGVFLTGSLFIEFGDGLEDLLSFFGAKFGKDGQSQGLEGGLFGLGIIARFAA